MRIGSLCSGAGGLDMAVEAVFDAETVWHCEINDAASNVLAHRWPGVPNHRDITTTDWDTVEPVDILTGGYPCQPFSQAGQRKGTDDERHIWPDVREAIRRLRPRITILENVAGHRSLGFDRVLGDLAEDGMHVRWTSLRAADVGSCHARDRVFLLVTPDSCGDRRGGNPQRDGWPQRPELETPQRNHADRCGVTPPDATGLRGADKPHRRNTIRQPLGTVTGAGDRDSGGRVAAGVRQLGGTADELAAVALLPTPQAHDAQGAKSPEQVATMRARGFGVRNLNETVEHELLATPQARDYKGVPADGFNTANLCRDVRDIGQQWGKYGPAIHHWENLTRTAPSPTEPNRNGKPRLNPAFSEWMMGWPAGWVTDVPGISRSDALRIIGNGVVPLQAEAAIRWLLNVACEVVA